MNNWWIDTCTQHTQHPVHKSLNRSLKETWRQATGKTLFNGTSDKALLLTAPADSGGAPLTLAWNWSDGWSISMDTKQELVFFVKKTTDLCTATVFEIHLIKPTKAEKPTRVMWLPTRVWATGSRMSQQRRGNPALCPNAVGNPHTEQSWWGKQGRTPYRLLT